MYSRHVLIFAIWQESKHISPAEATPLQTNRLNKKTARREARSLANVEFLESDYLHLDLPSDSYDAILANFATHRKPRHWICPAESEYDANESHVF